MFECIEIAESIYEGIIEPSCKNRIGKMATVLVTAGKLEDNTPCQILTLILVISMTRTEKCM